MRIRILGPLEIRQGDVWTRIGAPKWRSLLAALVVSPGGPLAVDQLIDEMWGDQPPRGAVNQVQGYVVRLRRLLSDPDGMVLHTHQPGYELVLSADDVDARRFEGLVQQGEAALRRHDITIARAILGEALDLWRGPALSDVAATALLRTEIDRLDERRLAALESRLEADLALARHAELVPELRQLCGAHPYRERFWGQLMLALYRSGRQAEALAAYQDLRRILDEELAVEPTAALRDLHQQILRADPDLDAVADGREPWKAVHPAALQVQVPHQLPAGVADFTGRDGELRRLDELLPTDDCATAAAVMIAAIVGTGGVGKTTLAVHWAHRVADAFPDGQLYASLRGYAPTPPREPLDVLAQFLHALGVPADQTPLDLDEAAAMYRTLVSGRRVLVVLDNAADAAQVRPLLPGSAGCVAVVTSRDQLVGLTALEGARPIELDRLDHAGQKGDGSRRVEPVEFYRPGTLECGQADELVPARD
ncbi:MAG TPA: AfsR/SARP family transcriptional regulator, partial [Actinopolymorphaceae bacterium]|nr:AfsR/SARP family transcriptional regulator [Actinopolymorphaceae bacterium]